MFCCCGSCLFCADGFDRAAGTTVGNGWREAIGSWSIVNDGEDVGALTMAESPAVISLDAACNPDAPPGTLFLDVSGETVAFPASSQISAKFLPLSADLPSVHRLWLGYIPNPSTGDEQMPIRGGIFLELEYGDRHGVNTAVMRLGSRSGGEDTWITEELPIGDSSSGYAGGSEYSAGEATLEVFLCWEPMDGYGMRSLSRVRGRVKTHTGTVYTLEGVSSDGDGRSPVLEAISGLARWDDISWYATAPDAPNCPLCGQCLYAKDSTNEYDRTLAAYDVGGTATRNLYTGHIELADGELAWKVPVPAQHSLTLAYELNWEEESPSFTVKDGAVTVAITKVDDMQHVTVTVDGTSHEFDSSLESAFILICYGHNKVQVQAGSEMHEFSTRENEGWTSISFEAGSTMASISALTVQSTRTEDVLNFGCSPCSIPPPPCELCPDAPATYALVEADVLTEFEDFDPGYPIGTLPAKYCFETPSAIVAERGILEGIMDGRCVFAFDDMCGGGALYHRISVVAVAERPTAHTWRIRASLGTAEGQPGGWFDVASRTYYSETFDGEPECPLREYELTISDPILAEPHELLRFAQGDSLPASKVTLTYPLTIKVTFVL